MDIVIGDTCEEGPCCSRSLMKKKSPANDKKSSLMKEDSKSPQSCTMDPIWATLPPEVTELILFRTTGVDAVVASNVNQRCFTHFRKRPVFLPDDSMRVGIFTSFCIGRHGLSLDFEQFKNEQKWNGLYRTFMFTHYIVHTWEGAEVPSGGDEAHMMVIRHKTKDEAVRAFTRSILVCDRDIEFSFGPQVDVCLDYGTFDRADDEKEREFSFEWTPTGNPLRRLQNFLRFIRPPKLTVVMDMSYDKAKVEDGFNCIVPSAFFELPEVKKLDSICFHGDWESVIFVTADQIRALSCYMIYFIGVYQTIDLCSDVDVDTLIQELGQKEKSLYVDYDPNA